MNSIETLQQLRNARLDFRVRLWKDVPETAHIDSAVAGTNLAGKLSLSAPTWIRKIGITFTTAPGLYHVEVSDHGAYSAIKNAVLTGASSVVVEDSSGFAVGEYIIFRGDAKTDKFIITEVNSSTDTITFDGALEHDYDAGETVEDTRWWRVFSAVMNDTAIYRSFGDHTCDNRMVCAYGQYWRILPETIGYKADPSRFWLWSDTYFDISAYLGGSIEINESVGIAFEDSPLTDASLNLINADDRFSRRNTASPYIDGGVNYLENPRRITVEWMALEPDYKHAVNDSDEDDWQLLCSFTARNWSIDRKRESSMALVSGETLSRLSSPTSMPMIEVKSVYELMRDHVAMADLRVALMETEGDPVEFRIAVIEQDDLDRTNTAFNEIIGRGTFGKASPLYFDPGVTDGGTARGNLLYAGLFGIASDGEHIYTAHSLEWDETNNNSRGLLIVRRGMNCVPDGTLHYFYESDNADIESGDICILGDYMWVHTAIKGEDVTYHVHQIDMRDWTVTDQYAKLGGAGHFPVHAVSANGFLYVMYDGGTEGRRIYKIDPSDYTADWTYTFDAANETRVQFGATGMLIIGTSTLLIFTKAKADSETYDRKAGAYYCVIYTLSDGSPYLTYVDTIPFTSALYDTIDKAESVNNAYGYGAVCQTNAGIISLTGPEVRNQIPHNKPSSVNYPQWLQRSGAFSNIGQTKFYLQNGRIINNRDEYDSPGADKDPAVFPLEELRLDGEILDNGLDLETDVFSATYDGYVKTTGDYSINLLTGEVIFVRPPKYGSFLKANYDYKPSVQYVSADNEERWRTLRDLAKAASGVLMTLPNERVGFKLMRKQEDFVLTSSATESKNLKGRHIIHPSNTAYGFNTVQVANAEHNTFYVDGTDYNITYNETTGVYTLTEIGSAMSGHIVITYLVGDEDDEILVLDNNAIVRPPSVIGLSESWSLSSIKNRVIVTGRKAYPTDTPLTTIETFAISPNALTVDTKFSKSQIVNATGQYDWDGDQKMFIIEDAKNKADGGLVFEFGDPMIVGTTSWVLREPNTDQVEHQQASSSDPAEFVKVTWDNAFYDPSSPTNLTANYDVAISNPLYWRVCTQADESEAAFPDEPFKTGEYVYVKKFRPGVADNANTCEVYAYAVKDTSFYIDKGGMIVEAKLNSSDNPQQSASPDKQLRLIVEPLSPDGVHLFREPDTYDGVEIPASLCLTVSSIKIQYDGVNVKCRNHSDLENYLKVIAMGYPIAKIENIRIVCEDRIRLNDDVSAIELQGEREKTYDNRFIQSYGMGQVLGFMMLDWLKVPHSYLSVPCKYMPYVPLLSPIAIDSEYGDFDATTELWLVVKKKHSIQTGTAGRCTTTLEVISVPNNPSAPPSGSS